MISSLQNCGLHIKRSLINFIATLTPVVSDRSSHQKENETTIALFLSQCLLSCFYFPSKLPVLLVYQVLSVTLSESWLLASFSGRGLAATISLRQCLLRVRRVTSILRMRMRTRDEHVGDVSLHNYIHAYNILLYTHTLSDFLAVLISVGLASARPNYRNRHSIDSSTAVMH